MRIPRLPRLVGNCELKNRRGELRQVGLTESYANWKTAARAFLVRKHCAHASAHHRGAHRVSAIDFSSSGNHTEQRRHCVMRVTQGVQDDMKVRT